jgi:hypothetical protein
VIFRNCLTSALSCLLAVLCSLSPMTANAQTNVMGQWTRLNDLPFVTIHNHLFPNGKVMMWGRNRAGGLWDPVTQTVTAPASAGYDQFCSGHVFLADGRLFVAGGHVTDNVGLPNASMYDPATDTWAAAPDMNAGRWYPTATTLANGDVLVLSGDVDTTIGANPLPQVYQTATNTWRDLTAAEIKLPYYPMMFLAPNGKVINVAASTETRYLDTTGSGAWSTVANRKLGYKDYGSAVMYADGKILLVGGGDPPTATAEVIDLNAAVPTWRVVGSMSIARRHLNATILPDGTVLVTGGSYGAGFDNQSTPVFSAELWNPVTETFTPLASASVPRLYHSAALLLADGRVLTTGGDNTPQTEVFSPPYLFKGTRPSMSAVPASINYGQQFSVTSGDAASISKVTLIRLASVTHAFNQNQRFNVLQFTARSGAIDITAPANANLAPPGHYMLYVLNGNGVPSVGTVVQLGAGAPPPPPPPPPAPVPSLSSLSPSSATAGGPAFTLTVNGSNFVSGASVLWNGSARTTSFVGATRLTAAIQAADIAAAGTAQVSAINPGSSASTALPFTVASAVATNTLSVSKNGTAASRGTVTSSPAGINCGSTCSAAFAGGSVTLTVVVNGNAVFAGWSGACTGTGPCTVTMDASKSVTATINRR